MSLLVNGTTPSILLIIHASDEHKSCLSYMTLLGKNISERTYVPRYYKKYAPAGSRTRGTSMGGLYVAATLLALLHRSGLRRTRRDCVIFPLL